MTGSEDRGWQDTSLSPRFSSISLAFQTSKFRKKTKLQISSSPIFFVVSREFRSKRKSCVAKSFTLFSKAPWDKSFQSSLLTMKGILKGFWRFFVPGFLMVLSRKQFWCEREINFGLMLLSLSANVGHKKNLAATINSPYEGSTTAEAAVIVSTAAFNHPP